MHKGAPIVLALGAAAALFLGLPASTPAVTPNAEPPKCESDAMIVFDASGSMTGMGCENTVTRIQQVRRALATVLPAVAPVRNLGLVAFGPGARSRT
ncbi:MAG TPA: VWA domain-containing protein, partial [Methyloceanibacter sp.]|nr:VWA domain-containing protein [Methyloceanibacter sp.]